ncbi:MAG: hypothetical protein IJ190_01610 [Prevotella sp.]|nr:hypothetical protein [Prevotella sp.]
MKKYLLMMTMMLTVWGCGMKAQGSADADKMTKEYVNQRVTDIYNDITEAVNTGKYDQFEFAKRYGSDLFKDLLETAGEWQQVAGIKIIDRDILLPIDGEGKFGFKDVETGRLEEQKADVELTLVNGGEDEYVWLTMVYENDDWFIDNIGVESQEGGVDDLQSQLQSSISMCEYDAEMTKKVLGEWINKDDSDDAVAVAFSLEETEDGSIRVGTCGVYGANYEYDAKAFVEGGTLYVTADGFNGNFELGENDQLQGHYKLTVPHGGETYEGDITMKHGW